MYHVPAQRHASEEEEGGSQGWPGARQPETDGVRAQRLGLRFAASVATGLAFRASGGAQLPCARARACASAQAHNTSIACRAYALQSVPSLTPVCWTSQQGWSRGFQDSDTLGQVQTTLQRMH